MSSPSRLFIVRHGDTFAPGDPPRRIGARTDLALVASGRAQAAALGGWLAARELRLAQALSGPLRRTRETATAILARLTDPPGLAIADWLQEIDHGPDENRREADVVARIGGAALARWDSAAVLPEGWVADVPARIAGWRGFVAGMSGDALLVTSNGAARFALLAFPALAAAVGPGMKLRTGAVAEIAVAADGAPSLVAWDVRPE